MIWIVGLGVVSPRFNRLEGNTRQRERGMVGSRGFAIGCLQVLPTTGRSRHPMCGAIVALKISKLTSESNQFNDGRGRPLRMTPMPFYARCYALGSTLLLMVDSSDVIFGPAMTTSRWLCVHAVASIVNLAQ
jgi:hypothetical protein